MESMADLMKLQAKAAAEQFGLDKLDIYKQQQALINRRFWRLSSLGDLLVGDTHDEWRRLNDKP